jgi:hypothetical protein
MARRQLHRSLEDIVQSASVYTTLINDAQREASELVEEYAGHTFVKQDGTGTRQRFSAGTTMLVLEYLDWLFHGSYMPVELSDKLTERVIDAARAFFVLACERHDTSKCLQNKPEWYDEVLSSFRVVNALKQRREQNSAA